jgi:hypothetical protein
VGPFKVKEPLPHYSASEVIKGTVSYSLFPILDILKASSLPTLKALIFPLFFVSSSDFLVSYTP